MTDKSEEPVSYQGQVSKLIDAYDACKIERDALRAENEQLKMCIESWKKEELIWKDQELRVTDLLSENENLRKQKDLYLELMADQVLRIRAAEDVAIAYYSYAYSQDETALKCIHYVKDRIDKRMEELRTPYSRRQEKGQQERGG